LWLQVQSAPHADKGTAAASAAAAEAVASSIASMTSDHIKSHLQKYRNNHRDGRELFLREFDRAYAAAQVRKGS
jgi:hypothetical protein